MKFISSSKATEDEGHEWILPGSGATGGYSRRSGPCCNAWGFCHQLVSRGEHQAGRLLQVQPVLDRLAQLHANRDRLLGEEPDKRRQWLEPRDGCHRRI